MSKPVFIAYSPKDRGKGKTHWHAIGAAWPTKEGNGWSIQLDSLPTDGRITLLPPKSEEAEGGAP